MTSTAAHTLPCTKLKLGHVFMCDMRCANESFNTLVLETNHVYARRCSMTASSGRDPLRILTETRACRKSGEISVLTTDMRCRNSSSKKSPPLRLPVCKIWANSVRTKWPTQTRRNEHKKKKSLLLRLLMADR